MGSNSHQQSSATSLVIVANAKGGVGKSLVALALADHAELSGAALRVVQVDEQDRLARVLRRKVITIGGDAREARRDPGADLRRFTPLHAAIERAVATGAHVLVDSGANHDDRLATWCSLAEFEDDLLLWGVSATIVVPVVAEAEACRLGMLTFNRMREALPSARLILVENERDGSFETLHPLSEAATAHRALRKSLGENVSVVALPRMIDASWKPFEAAALRFTALPTMSIEAVMRLVALPRPEARIARGDVAGWAGEVFAALDRVAPWAKSNPR